MTNPYEQREEELRRLSLRSYQHLVRGEFDVAEKVAREFLEEAENASDYWRFKAHLRLGTILENAGRNEQALRHAQAAQAASPDDFSWHCGAGLFGNLLLKQKDYAAAKTHFLQALESDPEDTCALCGMSSAEFKTGSVNDSRRYALKALEFARGSDDREHMSVAHNLLGDIEQDSGNLELAEKHFRSALSISEEVSRRRGISIACQRLLEIECKRENFDAGLEFGQRAIQVEKEMGRRAEVADACFRVAYLLKHVEQEGLLTRAKELCQLATDFADQPEDKAHGLREKAWFCLKLKQFEASEATLTEALSYVEESDELTVIIHERIGWVKYRQGHLREAEKILYQSLATAERFGHADAQVYTQGSLGFVFHKQGKTLKARRQWQAALQLAHDTNNQSYVVKFEKILAGYQPSLLDRIKSIFTWRT